MRMPQQISTHYKSTTALRRSIIIIMIIFKQQLVSFISKEQVKELHGIRPYYKYQMLGSLQFIYNISSSPSYNKRVNE